MDTRMKAILTSAINTARAAEELAYRNGTRDERAVYASLALWEEARAWVDAGGDAELLELVRKAYYETDINGRCDLTRDWFERAEKLLFGGVGDGS